MIEDVERLESQVERLRFRESDALGKGHIPVVQARTMKEAAVCIANLAGLFEVEERDCTRGALRNVGKDAVIEIGQTASRVGTAECSAREQLACSSQLRNIGSDGTGQGYVVTFRKLDGYAGSKRADAGQLPTTDDAL